MLCLHELSSIEFYGKVFLWVTAVTTGVEIASWEWSVKGNAAVEFLTSRQPCHIFFHPFQVGYSDDTP